MIMWVIRILVIVAGPVIGWYMVSPGPKGVLIGTGTAVLVILAEIVIQKVALDSLILGLIGAVLGLATGKLIDWLVYQAANPDLYEVVRRFGPLMYMILAYLGLVVFVQKKRELDVLDRPLQLGHDRKQVEVAILDTSVLIDGRVADIIEANFLSGRLVVPPFIVKELQHVADSSDALKRARGRRGLDLLKRLREHPTQPVQLFGRDYPGEADADDKIVQMAKELGARVVTVDLNLHKVAALQGVTVLNINDLAKALKPAHLPGEAMSLYLLKEGKQRGQAVGFLEDGTMVVVEDGKPAIGRQVDVTVTSVTQSSAGRMIFTKLS